MTIQLYAKDGHECIMFHDLVQADADAVQSNQFIVCHGDHMAVIDPGGMMTYNAIFLRRMQCFPKSQVDYIMASHADPDVVASLAGANHVQARHSRRVVALRAALLHPQH